MATEPVDMRKWFCGLSQNVCDIWRQAPCTGHLFVLLGKRRDRVKVTFWQKSGFLLLYKRLWRGRFQMPVINMGNNGIELDAAQLTMLLAGFDLNTERLRSWKPPQGDRHRQSDVIQRPHGPSKRP